MRKLLKLVAIGALLAVGPIQAFADQSDSLLIIDSVHGVEGDFVIVESAGVDMLLQDTTLVPIPTSPLFTLSGTTTHSTFTQGSHFLVLTEPSGGISDVLQLDIVGVSGVSITSVNIFFYDEAALPTIPPPSDSIFVNTRSETDFLTPQDVLPDLGITAPQTQALFMSDIQEAIPEPEIYAMMGIGLALMGFVARRRKLLEAAAA